MFAEAINHSILKEFLLVCTKTILIGHTKFRHRLFSLAVCCLTFLHLNAQHALYHYTIKDGLPSNKIYGITQGKDGYIWIATDRGIARFNGKTFQKFDIERGLPTNDVFYCYIDPLNRTWLFDFSPYLTYIYRDTVHRFKVHSDNKIFFKTQFLYDRGKIFVTLANEQLVIADGKSIRVRNIDSIIRQTFPSFVSEPEGKYPLISSDIICVANGHGLYFSDRQRGIKRFYPNMPGLPFPYTAVKMIPKLFNKYLVFQVGAREGHFVLFNLYSGIGTILNLERYFPGFTHTRLYDVFEDNIQFATNKGLLVLDSNLQVKDIYKMGMPMNAVYKDASGSYWVTTFDDGLFFISNEVSSFRAAPLPFIRDKKIRYLRYTGGRYFIVDNENVLYIVDSTYRLRKTIALKPFSGFGADQRNYFILQDKKNGCYIILSNGLYYLDKNDRLWDFSDDRDSRDRKIPVILESLKSCAYSYAEDKLIFSNHNTVNKVWFDGHLHVHEALQQRVTNIHIDQSGNYWLSNDLGNMKLTDTSFGVLRQFDIRHRITGLVTDSKKNILIAVDGAGIRVYNDSDSHAYIYKGNDLLSMSCDSSGLWIVTGNAIKRYQAQAHGYTNTNTYLNLEGLLYEDVYQTYARNDSVYILCDKGIITSCVTYPTSRHELLDESLTVSAIRLGEEYYVMTRTDSFFSHEYKKENMNISLSSNSTPYFGNVTYQYWLEGKETGWQISQEDNISYPALSPGTYRLHVKAELRNAEVSSKEKVFTIIIKPLWWQSIWFRLALGLLAVSIASFIVFLRISAIKSKAKATTELNKKMAGLELTALQAQMNPHFIFNALSSIQSFIKQNDTALAFELLQKFSLLIRLYLEFSRHKMVGLKQEMKALQLYTDIEQMRFSNKFVVDIKVRANTSVETVFLPPMMIQPLVENAINHGLYHKEGGGGILKILFWIRGTDICVFIDDNGIGRAKAKKLRSKIFPSRGNQLIKDRLEMLSASGLGEGTLNVKDKYSKHNNPAGTRVTLKLNISNHD